MVSSKTCKTISLAISLLVVVISLTGTALAATAPTISTLARYAPEFKGAPGKMATDAAGNLYVADFWAKGIVKLDRQGSRIGFIPTTSRPSAIAVMPDSRLVVAMSAPQAKVAFYAQTGSAPNVTGEEVTSMPFGAPTEAYCRPSGVAIDGAGYIYVVDAGDAGTSTTDNVGKVRVYSSTGSYLYAFGVRTATGVISTTGGEFKQPLGIAYEKANNQIVVADSNNGRLQFFSAYNGSTCTYVKSVGVIAGQTNGVPTEGVAVKFGDPVDVSFDYIGSALNRIYVADRARGQVTVVDPANNVDLKHVSGLNLPSAVLIKDGMLYANSAATSTGNNVVVFGLVSGATMPNPTVALAITSVVPPTTTTGQSPLVVSGTVSPVQAVNCSVNGGADTLATPSGSAWSVSLGLVSGYNYILCKASDGTTTTFAEASTYYSGALTTAPVPTIASPAAGIYTNNATIVVSGSTDVAGANIKLSNANNNAVASTVSGTDRSWSATISLAEGANAITVSAWKTGTAVGTASITVNADFTPPNMTGKISFLANGATTVTAVQNLDGIVVEKNLSSVVVNGNIVTAKVALPAADNTYFSIPVTLVRGSNTITVTATDLAGNSSTLTRTVTLNPELPALTVALPGDNSYAVGAGTATANGAVDTIFTAVDACGAAVTPAGGTWSTTGMPVGSGLNSCQFTASGGSAAVSEKRTINADAAYAQLAITNPPADLATNSPSVILSGTVAAGSPVPTISIDGGTAVNVSSYNSGTGAFSHTVALATEGSHTVKVMANAATTAIRNIIYDTAIPVIAVQANANTSPSTLTGTIEPSNKLAGIVLRVSGTDTALPLGNITFDPYDATTGAVVWHANLLGYAYDSLTITSVNPAGSQAQHVFVAGIPTGDIDGDGVVRLSDAMACLRHVAGTEILPGSALDKNTPRFQADVGSLIDSRAAQDGAVTVEDAVLILRKAYGLMTF